MAERTVIVHRSFDPLQAEMLGDVLRDAGLAAQVVGTRSGAAIGVGQVGLHLHIAVPAAQAAQATEVLAAFLAGDGAELLRSQGELPADAADDDEADGAAAESPRRAILAVGMAVIGQVGLGHLYVRRPATALVLFAGHLVALRLVLQPGHGWSTLVAALVLHAALVAVDAVGAALAVRRPAAVSLGRQLAVGLAMLAGSGAVAALLGPRVPQPEERRDGFDPTGGLGEAFPALAPSPAP